MFNMYNMKRTVLFIFATILLTTSCATQEDRAMDVADKFLSSYFSSDYESVSTLCSEELASFLLPAFQDVEADSTVMAIVKELSKNVNYNLLQADTKSEKGKAFVEYEVILPESVTPIKKSLQLVKGSDGWLVDSLN